MVPSPPVMTADPLVKASVVRTSGVVGEAKVYVPFCEGVLWPARSTRSPAVKVTPSMVAPGEATVMFVPPGTVAARTSGRNERPTIRLLT